jgi:hypothetical protein
MLNNLNKNLAEKAMRQVLLLPSVASPMKSSKNRVAISFPLPYIGHTQLKGVKANP